MNDDDDSLLCDEEMLPAVIVQAPLDNNATKNDSAQTTSKNDEDDEDRDELFVRLQLEQKYLFTQVNPSHSLMPYYELLYQLLIQTCTLLDLDARDESIPQMSVDLRNTNGDELTVHPNVWQSAWMTFLRVWNADMTQKQPLLTKENAVSYLAIALHLSISLNDTLARYIDLKPSYLEDPKRMCNRTVDVCNCICAIMCMTITGDKINVKDNQEKESKEQALNSELSTFIVPITSQMTTAFYSSLQWCLSSAPCIADWIVWFREDIYTRTKLTFVNDHIEQCLSVSDYFIWLPKHAKARPSVFAFALLTTVYFYYPGYDLDHEGMAIYIDRMLIQLQLEAQTYEHLSHELHNVLKRHQRYQQ